VRIAQDPRYGRSFMARSAAVCSPHELASVAGLEMLQSGGTAVDAMVAVNATLGVVYPHMSGAGGDAFWLIHDAGGQQHVLNASGRAAAAATRERYTGAAIDARGPAAALTVPGAVDGWICAHNRFGRLTLAECLRPAIRYARDGFPVCRSLVRFGTDFAELLRAVPTTAAVYLKRDGTPYGLAGGDRRGRTRWLLRRSRGAGDRWLPDGQRRCPRR
jgi:oxamate amidohydrolase